jgi:DNA-binding NarL/FixJ family response regulator
MAVTDHELRTASLKVERTRKPYQEALQARQALIRRALAQGIKAAHVARETGLSRTAIGKLVSRRPMDV